MQKTGIIGALGERDLLLPAYVERALNANGQVKYLFTLLQESKHFADHPESGAIALHAERIAAGVEDATLDETVAGSTSLPDGLYRVPRVADLHGRIVALVEEMIAALDLRPADAEAAAKFRSRVQDLLTQAPRFADEIVPGEYIDRITSGRRENGDSLHLVVMDLHKAINHLQATLAQESIGGARVYGVNERDRMLIGAFMDGLNRTAPLKFDHPGLDTTATRCGDRLTIENDIGTTESHVLVTHVSGGQVTITYTDIHIQRAEFFENLFESYAVQWDDTRSREQGGADDNRYYLCTGRFTAPDDVKLREFLSFLGSRIVFLIDWNKARKRLRNFLRKPDCLGVLKWAADNDYGHRGFLQVGGEVVVYEALAQVPSLEQHYGERLDEVLGRREAVDFLKFVLQVSSTGLRDGRSEKIIRDEIKAEIFECFQSVRQGILDLCADHAASVFELADAVRDAMLRAGEPGTDESLVAIAARAKRWESRADDLLNRVRDASRRTGDGAALRSLVEDADDVADALEDAAFLLTLTSRYPVSDQVREPLQSLADLLVEGAQEYVACIETGRHLERGGEREDRQDFLENIDCMVSVEHRTDAAERRLLAALAQDAGNAAQVLLLSRLAGTFEEAADALARCAVQLKNQLLEDVLGR